MNDFEAGSYAEREELSRTNRLGCHFFSESSYPEKWSKEDLEEHRARTKKTFRYENSKLVN